MSQFFQWMALSVSILFFAIIQCGIYIIDGQSKVVENKVYWKMCWMQNFFCAPEISQEDHTSFVLINSGKKEKNYGGTRIHGFACDRIPRHYMTRSECIWMEVWSWNGAVAVKYNETYPNWHVLGEDGNGRVEDE